MRDSKRLAEIRKLSCVRCGNPDSQAAHSNSAKHGKGRGIKASDEYTVPLCHLINMIWLKTWDIELNALSHIKLSQAMQFAGFGVS